MEYNFNNPDYYCDQAHPQAPQLILSQGGWIRWRGTQGTVSTDFERRLLAHQAAVSSQFTNIQSPAHTQSTLLVVCKRHQLNNRQQTTFNNIRFKRTERMLQLTHWSLTFVQKTILLHHGSKMGNSTSTTLLIHLTLT